MDYFLQGPAHELLSSDRIELCRNPKDFRYFKGRFPVSVAEGFYGDRYVTIGDAAGLVRAFKGKGINSACLTGLWAARAIMTTGISARAFQRSYVQDCRELLCDIPYGHLVRHIVINASRLRQVDPVLALAEDHPALSRALLDAVSGHRLYRSIICELLLSPVNRLP
jgi:flavin-dependent dehydrogenase